MVKSSISFIDGDKGILQYRGYAIEELAEKATFLEVAYLLIYGELPTKVCKIKIGTLFHPTVPGGVNPNPSPISE